MQTNSIAITLAILALILSIVALVRIPRDPYEAAQIRACNNAHSQCNTQCDLIKNQALGEIRLDSSMAVLQRNQDLLTCRLDNLGNNAAIQQCQQQVNTAFDGFIQTLAGRRNNIEGDATTCRNSCTESHNECLGDVEPLPSPSNEDADCVTEANACTISVPAPCEHREIDVKVSCEELECMGIPCRGDIPEIPVCIQPGPIEDGFEMEFRITDATGKELDRFPALQPDPDCQFRVRNDEKTVNRIRKHENAEVHLVIKTKAKAPYSISLRGKK